MALSKALGGYAPDPQPAPIPTGHLVATERTPAQPHPDAAKPLALPDRPAEVQLWSVFLAGAAWADGEYPEPEDADFWLHSAHGRAMLSAFYVAVEAVTERPRGKTMCPVGRPYRLHERKCSPECDWREGR